MGHRALSLGGLLVAAVLLVALNMVAGRMLSASRVDLTENKLFTLSAGTRQVLAELDEPITLRFYLSRGLVTRLPGVSSYAARVQELLEAYQREAGGNVTLVTVDPEPFSDEEDRAVAYGLRGVPVDEEDATLYFGLVASGSTDQEQVIPFFSTSREQFLEYDVTRLVYTVANPKQPTVGLLSTLPINGGGPMAMLQGRGQPPWIVVEQVRELFELLPLEPGIREVPEEVDVLMLVHPKGLPDETRYAIDQFVMRGGRALVFVDPNAETDPGTSPGMPGMMMPGADRSSNPKALLASWGVEMPEDEVVGDLSAAIRVRAQAQGRLVTIDYPLWMTLGGDALAVDDLVTSNLGSVTLASPGHLLPLEDSGLEVRPLIRASDSAALFPRATVQNLSDPQAVLRDYQPAGERFVLAVRVTGAARSAFPDGPPAPKTDGAEAPPAAEAERPAHIAESRGDINVVVVADADMLADQFWVQVQDLLGSRIAIPTSGNGPMVVNALDNLTGSSALIDIRSRGGFVRPFTVVNDLRREAELKFREQEQRLINRLEETERQLGELESTRQGDDVPVLTEEQRNALIDFRKERLQIRKDLREVRRSLRASIERLEARMKFANVALVPILIGIGGLVVGLARMRRRRRSLLAAGTA
jgi:ABC-type uncharacterized transport system involved in gliding motility auxiliary subunit